MRLNGGIYYNYNGLTTSIRAMHLQSVLLEMRNENVGGFDKIGYQRKEPVVSSFTEYMGVNALSETIDDKVGRIGISGNPLDIAIANKGYFQVETPNGIKLTRDGRFKIDKDGSLLTLEDFKVLSTAGEPIKLPTIPQDLNHIKVDREGKIQLFDEKKQKLSLIGRIGVVDANGIAVTEPNIKQGYNEYSNVSLQEEFIKMMPIMKNFDANRQMFMLQNSVLGKAIQQLGSS
jgi:flagellar basal body rod protein FlgG